MMNSRIDFRIYYEDTDAGGVVYYANYLKFAERARTEMLREAGINQSQLLSEEQRCFVVRHIESDFLLPARFDDLITVHTSLTSLQGATLQIVQQIKRNAELLITMKVLIACVNSTSMKPARIPAWIREVLDSTGELPSVVDVG